MVSALKCVALLAVIGVVSGARIPQKGALTLEASAVAETKVRTPTIEIAPGVHMPMVGLGTWLYNSSRAKHAVELALKVGYTHVDTALMYENQKGVGEALAGFPRDSFFVTTKIPGGLNFSAASAAIQQDLDELQLDYIDLLIVHFPATWPGEGGKQMRQEGWKAMEEFVKKGKLRAIGVSHFCKRHVEDILEINTVPIALNQVQYHVGMGTSGPLANDDKEYMESKGIVYESFSSLCGPCNTTELLNGPLVTKIGATHGKTGAQVSLKWLVQQGIPVIPKSDKVEHLKENLDLFGWELTKDQMAALTAATSPPIAGDPDLTSGD
eukprot:417748-Pyramimonas_sp.AAC.1